MSGATVSMHYAVPLKPAEPLAGPLFSGYTYYDRAYRAGCGTGFTDIELHPWCGSEGAAIAAPAVVRGDVQQSLHRCCGQSVRSWRMNWHPGG